MPRRLGKSRFLCSRHLPKKRKEETKTIVVIKRNLFTAALISTKERDCLPALLTPLGLRSALIYRFIAYLINILSACLALNCFLTNLLWEISFTDIIWRALFSAVAWIFSSSVYDCCKSACNFVLFVTVTKYAGRK